MIQPFLVLDATDMGDDRAAEVQGKPLFVGNDFGRVGVAYSLYTVKTFAKCANLGLGVVK